MKRFCLPRCLPLPLPEGDCADGTELQCLLVTLGFDCVQDFGTTAVPDYSEATPVYPNTQPTGTQLDGITFINVDNGDYGDRGIDLVACLWGDAYRDILADAISWVFSMWVEWTCDGDVVSFQVRHRLNWVAANGSPGTLLGDLTSIVTADRDWHLGGELVLYDADSGPGYASVEAIVSGCEAIGNCIGNGGGVLDLAFTPQGTGCDLWDVPAGAKSITLGSFWSYTGTSTDYISAARLIIDNVGPNLWQARLQILYMDDPDNFEVNLVEYTAPIDFECVDGQFFGTATFLGSSGLCAYGGPGTDPVMVIDFTGPAP